MEESEFDKFAEEYNSLLSSNIRASGETPEFFAEYKVKDTARVVQEFGLPPKLSLLDFGSGTGSSVSFFLRHIREANITCLDVSRKSLDIGSRRFKGKAEFKHFDGRTIPVPNNTFHLVFAACVFHHIPHDAHERLLSEILRILRPNGIFIVFEHNPYNPLTVRAVNTCPFDKNAQLIHAADFRNLIRQVGFNSDHLRYRIFFPGSLRFLRPLERLLTWLPLGAQYSVHARKSN